MSGTGNQKMKLYYFPNWRSVRNIWLIKEMEVEDDFEFIRHKPGEDADADAAYRSIHPHGTIPALVIPGKPPLVESGSICMYLADKYGKFVPDIKHRDAYYDLMIFSAVTVDGILDFFYEKFFTNAKFSEEKEKQMRSKLSTSWDYLTKRLEGHEYICGDEFTAVDCVFGYSVWRTSIWNDGDLLKNQPKLHEYLTRLLARPAFQAAIKLT